MFFLFAQGELQSVIGGTDRDFNVANLRMNAVYTGGYWGTDAYVEQFWSVVTVSLPLSCNLVQSIDGQ